MKLKVQSHPLDTLNSLVLVIAQLKKQGSTAWVDENFLQSLVQAEVRLRDARTHLITAKESLKGRAAARHLHGGELVQTIRDFYLVLTHAAKRDKTKEQWLSIFSGKSELPSRPTLNHPWFEVAQRIVDTHQELKAALHENAQAFETPLPSNPSAEEVATRLQVAQDADRAWREATLLVKAHSDELQAAKKHVLKLLTALRFALRFKMVGWPHEQRRKVLRVFGFTFEAEAREADGTKTSAEAAPGADANQQTVIPDRATA